MTPREQYMGLRYMEPLHDREFPAGLWAAFHSRALGEADMFEAEAKAQGVTLVPAWAWWLAALTLVRMAEGQASMLPPRLAAAWKSRASEARRLASELQEEAEGQEAQLP